MRSNKGFTIIELMLSMTFVSVLMIAIALLTIQISNTYTRGITMRQVNTAGQELANDLQRSVQAAQAIDLDEADADADYVVFMNTSTNRVRKGAAAYNAVTGTDERLVMGGRLCVGGLTYSWNTGSYLLNNNGTGSPNVLNGTPVRLAKTKGSGSMCDGTVLTDFGPLDPAATDDLFATGDRELAIHKLYVSGAADRGLYAIGFTIGTNRQGTLTDDSDSCRPPGEDDSDIDYCTVNRFDIVTRTIPDKSGGS